MGALGRFATWLAVNGGADCARIAHLSAHPCSQSRPLRDGRTVSLFTEGALTHLLKRGIMSVRLHILRPIGKDSIGHTLGTNEIRPGENRV